MGRAIFAIAIGIGGIAILLALGTWQVQRLAEKRSYLDTISQKIADAPVDLSAVAEAPERYTPVRLRGRFTQGHIRVLASRKSIGPVYRILRPFEALDVGRIVVDTGWIRDGIEVAPVPAGEMTLIGNLDAPNEIDGFTPEPDLESNIWFARDVPALAVALDARAIMVVLREKSETDLGVTPWPVDTAGIPNDHLQYAITWFSLALIWGAMTLYFLMRNTRSRTES